MRRIIRLLCLANGVWELGKTNSAQSALDLLVLTILQRRGPIHGYGIATTIQDLSQEALRIEEGSLYPALHRMEEMGWITAEWKMSETGQLSECRLALMVVPGTLSGEPVCADR